MCNLSFPLHALSYIKAKMSNIRPHFFACIICGKLQTEPLMAFFNNNFKRCHSSIKVTFWMPTYYNCPVDNFYQIGCRSLQLYYGSPYFVCEFRWKDLSWHVCVWTILFPFQVDRFNSSLWNVLNMVHFLWPKSALYFSKPFSLNCLLSSLFYVILFLQ